MVVINKPPGVSAHGGETVTGPTVSDFLLERFPQVAGVGDDPVNRPGIVHRLDKDTSGLMVAALNQSTFEGLKQLFMDHKVEKTYWAIVCGKPREMQGVIAAPIGRLVANPLKRGIEQGRSRIRGAREAVTEYKVLRAGTDYSLVELKPKTGRMHQLRVHMLHLGHPILGDDKYGRRESYPRLALHAQSIGFMHPITKQYVEFSCTIPFTMEGISL